MSLNKKILILLLILFPSLCFNYLTLTFLDHNHSLSIFSTIFIIIFNLANIIFGLIYYKYNFKIIFFLFLYCIFLFLIFDFTLEKIVNKKSIYKEDTTLGWILRSNREITLIQETFKRNKYKVEFKTSKIDGFREYGDTESKNKKILVIGDSYTGDPYSSNETMYYNIIKNILIKNNIILDWFVMGAGGYGTAQQLLLLEKYQDKIKPDIILHQFCVNDFFDNSYEISRLSTAHDQYYRRPFIENNKIFKVNNTFSKIYRFLYKYSFIFKKFDQIYNYKQFRTFGRFTKKIPNEFIEKSIYNTQDLIFKIRELVGIKTLYFSINCADKKNKILTPEWEKIIKKINGYPLTKPGNKIIELKDEDIDVMHEDGGHLNTYGNKIYGELAAEKMVKIIKKEN